MKVYTKVIDLQKALTKLRKLGKSIGFAPTMGALHEGHASLVLASKDFDDITICSVFVNPTQFNEIKDLEKYPRTLEADKKLLKRNGVDILFAPDVEEIYPPDTNTRLNLSLNGLDTVMEGKFRPGHFEGMAQVVKRLLDIVQADRLYMGQKDFQQFTIVQAMIDELNIPTTLMICPIIRELDGLAMSSRNVRLTEEYRVIAPIIHQVLSYVKRNKYKKSISDLKKYALKSMKLSGLKPEYFEIVNGYNLKSQRSIKKGDYVVACVAAWAGDVRLIDNEIL